jgi:hypothetical protein
VDEEGSVAGDAGAQDIQYNIDFAVLIDQLEKVKEKGQEEQRHPEGAEHDLESLGLKAEDAVKNIHNQ